MLQEKLLLLITNFFVLTLTLQLFKKRALLVKTQLLILLEWGFTFFIYYSRILYSNGMVSLFKNVVNMVFGLLSKIHFYNMWKLDLTETNVLPLFVYTPKKEQRPLIVYMSIRYTLTSKLKTLFIKS